jgi:hypothetical protein
MRRLVTSAVVAALVAAGAAPAAARRSGEHAAELDAAQRALARLRYEEARTLLERAWRSGDNGPAALALIFRLQGEVAATLGDTAGARRAFVRWLVIDPGARLDEGASPKFVSAFDDARAQLGGAALRVDVEVDGAAAPGGAQVTLVVVADPLAMIAGARASYTGEGGVLSLVEGKGSARVALPLPGAGGRRVVVAAVDGFGNRLVERPIVVERPQAAPTPEPAPPPRTTLAPAAPASVPASSPPPARSTFASPWLWTGVSAGLAVAGGVFAWRVSDAEAELAELNAHSAEHDFAEARAVEDRRQTSATIMVVSLAAAGASAVAAVWLALDDDPPSSQPAARVGFAPAPGGGQVSFEWSF